MNGIKLTKLLCAAFFSAALALSVTAPSNAAKPASKSTQQTVSSLVNINKADAKMLDSLPGIGLKKAQQIVSYRKLNGDFKSIEELANVKGIGPKMVAKIATKVRIK